MSGLEPLAGFAAAAEGIAQKALSSSEVEKQALADSAAKTPEMEAAGREWARGQLYKQSVVTLLFRKLAAILGMREEYFADQFGLDLAERTQGVAEADLCEPRPSVALPAMQGLSYSLEEPELKEMYLNLLAKAMVKQTTTMAHPAFADVIKQLSAAEVLVLEEVLAGDDWPIVQRRTKALSSESAYDVAQRRVLGMRDREGAWLRAEETGVWVDNWERLGLIETSFENTLANEGIYDWCAEHPDTAGADFVESKLIAPTPMPEVFIVPGALSVTDFGRRFLVLVVPFGGLRSSD